MRAIGQGVLGGPEVLRVVEVDRPEPGIAEVLVRVHAAGVNPTDYWHRQTGGPAGRPIRLGRDLSGVVEAVGLGVSLFRPGDAVYGMPRQPREAGTYADYVVSPARHLARKPRNLTHLEAAALPMAALTAWQSLVDTADVRPGRRVLVHAAGGVGHLAVQIAKARDAYVVGTARAAKHEFVRSPGADEMVDYPQQRRDSGHPEGRREDRGTPNYKRCEPATHPMLGGTLIA
jgi:NADPH:quinone reductase-like Zn-dependent oxidoreductase